MIFFTFLLEIVFPFKYTEYSELWIQIFKNLVSLDPVFKKVRFGLKIRAIGHVIFLSVLSLNVLRFFMISAFFRIRIDSFLDSRIRIWIQ